MCDRRSAHGGGEVFATDGPEATRRLAARLIERFGKDAIFALHGELGAGKTCLVQGMARALGVREPVTSPTFALVHEYDGAAPLTHIDLYRLADEGEILELGWDELLERPGIKAIEWAERAAALLPDGTVHVTLDAGDAPERRCVRVWRVEAGA